MMNFLVLYSPFILVGFVCVTLLLPRVFGWVRPVGVLLLITVMLGVLITNQGSWSSMVAYFNPSIFLFDYMVLAQINPLNFWVVLLFLLALGCLVTYAVVVQSRLYWLGLISYGGGALGAVLTKDWLVFFFFWELVALGSTLLVAYGRTGDSFLVVRRYLMVHLCSGLCLLVGILLLYMDTGSWYIYRLNVHQTYSYWILVAFLIKIGFIGFHGWLVESYPTSSPMSWPALSVFSTKLGMFCLVRSFFGWDVLIDLGMIMMLYPVFFALMTRDVGRILSYSLLAQLGVMLILVGIGTPIALNALMLHLFVHVFYKLLFFMVMGTLCVKRGLSSSNQLQLSWRADRVLLFFLWVASAALIGFPLTGAFVSKGLIFEAISQLENNVLYYLVFLGTALPFLYGGVRLWYLLFSKSSAVPVGEKRAVGGMYLSAALVCALVLFSGILFDWVNHWLPYPTLAIDFDLFSSMLKVLVIIIGGVILSALWYYLGWMNRFLGWWDIDQLWAKVLRLCLLKVVGFLPVWLGFLMNKVGGLINSLVGGLVRFSQWGVLSSWVFNVWLVILTFAVLLFLV